MYYTCPWRLGTIRSSLARGMRHRHMIILNPFTHRLRPRRRAPAPSEPSTVAARLHVISSTCRLAGPLPGTSARSHSAYSCPGGRLAHVCSLRKDVDNVLRKAMAMNFGLKNMGALRPQPPRFCPNHASVRPETPHHASAASFLSHAAPAAVC